jgi:hypothetical protein
MTKKKTRDFYGEAMAAAKGNGKTKVEANDRGSKSNGSAKVEVPDDLFERLYAFVGRFVAYPSEHARVAHVLWIAHSHMMEAWDSTPRIAFLSPEPRSGKTRALEVTELLVPRPVEAVNMTPAYLFRKVGSPDGRSTILHDEIDTVFGPKKAKDNEEIRALLNAGHRKNAVAGRCVTRGKIVETEEIPAYAAVALAGLGWLPETILSRSILIRMRRRGPDEMVEQYRSRIHAREGHHLRDLLAAWAAKVECSFIDRWPFPQMPPGIEDRDADCWESLLAIADEIGGDGGWSERARAAAVALVAASQDVEPSLGIRLLADLRTVFGDAEALPTTVILQDLLALPESPWGDLKGHALNDRGLAHRLRQYSIKPKVIRVGNTTPRGYAREDLHEAWKRYLPPPPSSHTSATSATNATNEDFQGLNVADEDSPYPQHAQHVADAVAAVADAKPYSATGFTPENLSKPAFVADVADVALPAGNGEGSAPPPGTKCDHCKASSPGRWIRVGDEWLHRECHAYRVRHTGDDKWKMIV